LAVQKRWVIARPEPAQSERLARALRLPVALAQLLLNRGYRDLESARKFLNPQLRQLRDPFELPDMERAVDRVRAAIAGGQRILIYGDYDVDGISASALLKRLLSAAGACVRNFLPHRIDEGYGLSEDGLARCLRQHKPDLLIAVDCGTSSVSEISNLKSRGIDVIVLDHHEPPERLPDCAALVNPKRHPDGEPLASVGVAFKFAHALLKRDRKLAGQIDLREHLDLVATGTVADIVPLRGENRILVKAGLDRLPATRKPGLRALIELAAVPEKVTPYHIGFRIGPRLNAAGRLADAMAALELLLTEDTGRAAELAALLDRHNAQRQQIEERIVEEAFAAARQCEGDRVLVLANEAWHPGVIGIVASRVAAEFYRPSVIIGADGKGSCRSISGFSIVEALRHCAKLLEKFGGHEMAAGLNVKPGNVGRLRRALNEYAGRVLGEEDLLPRVTVDATVQLGELDEEFFRALQRFEPCGVDNPAPVFAVLGVRLHGRPRLLKDKHLKFYLTDGETVQEAVWWGVGARELPAGAFDVAFVPELNEYGGVKTVQLRVRDVRESVI
jgi:single-stranded-DNA-specific exonuclease